MFKCKHDSVQSVILRADPCKPRRVDVTRGLTVVDEGPTLTLFLNIFQ